MPPRNLHATVVVVGDRGVLITGKPGAGKSTLALALIASCRRDHIFARLVCDDQVFATHVNGKWLAQAPPTIRNLVEIHGLGPTPIEGEASAVIDLAVDLVSAAAAPRFQEPSARDVAGAPLPTLKLAQRNAATAVLAIRAQLGF